MLSIQSDGSSKSDLFKFYSQIFPAEKLINWLSGSSDPKPHNISKREFSFTLPGGIYTRFLSFSSIDEFRERLKSQLPVKIDIGAVYTARPSERKSLGSSQFRPVEKELVFDIDMTDYDDVRNCCKDKGICQKCWKFIAVAVKIIDQSLAQDFGFSHRIWVFSGRRGIHCWVSDERARKLSANARKAIISFIELKRGGSEVKRKLQLPQNIHPSLRRSLEIIKLSFPDIMLNDQDFLNMEKSLSTFMKMLPENIKSNLLRKWSIDQGALTSEKWTDFLELVEENFNKSNSMNALEIQAYLLYPRLDANVSMQLNHLLKSPFCVHPDTGKICVPLKVSDIDSFDPNNCPTLKNVLTELEQGKDLASSSLAPYLEIFETHINEYLNARKDPGESHSF